MKEEPKFCKELFWTNILYISNLFPEQLVERTPSNEVNAPPICERPQKPY